MDIVICTDKNYVMPCGVMLYSICKNNKSEDITFHIICDNSLDNKDQQSLKKTILLNPENNKKIIFYIIGNESLNDFPRLDKTTPKNYITKATYYRLYIAKILPNSIDKVLYLDCDIIVRHSLKELWNTDISNISVAVVPDVAEGLIDKYNRLHYPQNKGYFNSGVLLLNLKKWRQEDKFSAFITFMNEHPDWIKLHDQDVMNRVFYDDKISLPIKYNFQEGFLWNDIFYDYWKYEDQVLAARKDPVILHFTDSKPWVEGCEHPYRDEFFKYQKETEWAGTPLLTYGPTPRLKHKIMNYIKNILRHMKILSPLPTYPPKYINLDNNVK